VIKNRYTIVLLTLLMTLRFYSQTANIDCKGILLDYMTVLESLSAPKKGQVAYLKFETEIKQKDNKIVKSSSEIISSKDRLVIKGNNMQTYADIKNVFVVVPRVKSIYWNSSSKQIFEKSSLKNNYFNLEKKLIDSAENISCNSQGNTITIRIIANSNFRKETKIKSQEVIYNVEKKQVKSVKNNFVESAKYRYQEINYTDMTFNSKKVIKEASRYIFKGNQLFANFKNYQVIDNRKK